MIKKLLKFSGNIIFLLSILLIITLLFSLLQTNKNSEKLPSLFGFNVLTVLSGSMEPLLERGDLVIIKPVNFDKLEKSEIVTYRNNANTLVTHRIVEILREDGKVLLQTKGDANNIVDEELVTSEQLVGSMKFSIPKAGLLLSFIKTPMGLMILVAVPFIYIILGLLSRIIGSQKKGQAIE